MDRLPPLNPLRAFEAAGRLRSIRRAAEELSVTPGAVSRQVQSLEAYLGLPLFRRDPREIVLTVEGEQYLEAVSGHLEGIRAATQRLTSFHDAHPMTEVRLTTSNETVDFERENVDGAVRLGDGVWPGVDVDKLLPNELVPLCTPAYRRKFELRSLEDIGRVRLLHSLIRPDDWKFWLEAAGIGDIDPYAGAKFASSTLAYQATLEGQGIMMAQKALFVDDLKSRKLVQPFRPALDRGDHTYYFIYPRNRLRNPAFRKFRQWLLEQASPA